IYNPESGGYETGIVVGNQYTEISWIDIFVLDAQLQEVSSMGNSGGPPVLSSPVIFNLNADVLENPPAPLLIDGFETGYLDGWSVQGYAEIDKVPAYEGQYLVNLYAYGDDGVSESRISRSITIPAGYNSLKLAYNFFTNEYPPAPESNDGFYVTLTGSQGQVTYCNVDTFSPDLQEIDPGLATTGWQVCNIDISSLAGTGEPVELGIVMYDANGNNNSAVDIDAIYFLGPPAVEPYVVYQSLIQNINNSDDHIILANDYITALYGDSVYFAGGISSAAVDDLDNDGENEVVLGMERIHLGEELLQVGGVHAFNVDGSLLWTYSPHVGGIPEPEAVPVNSSPAIADLNRDGVKEVVYLLSGGAADRSNALLVLTDTGTAQPTL
ncbi:MAG: hypothetical protein GY869_19070, partial [Planctomycetes bacterium]|nr:hypothetical protein [Planctomycetota bacterium]